MADRRKRVGIDVVINEKVTTAEGQQVNVPCVELVDRSTLERVAIVLGPTQGIAKARAEVFEQVMTKEQAGAWTKKRLRLIAWYQWSYKRMKRHPFGLAALIFWLISIELEPQQAGRWLRDTFPSELERPQENGGAVAGRLAAYG